MNRKEEYKDLEKWRETKNSQKRKYYGKTKNAKNGHQIWTNKEIEMVMKHEMTDTQLSKIIERSVASIQTKRCLENKKAKQKSN